MNSTTIALRALAIALLMAHSLFGSAAIAQTWPNKPVRLIVPFPPGGGNDVFARELAAALQTRLGQSFVVDNRGGAAGNIGISAAAQSAPDGYTLLVVSNTLVTNPALSANTPYNIYRDLTPISLAAILPVILVTRAQMPQADLTELVAYAKAHPGAITYGTGGIGSPHHLTTEYFNSKVGIDLLHVPFKGQGPLMPELLAGRIDMAFLAISSVMPFLPTGRVRGLAMAGERRTALAPDIPTLAQAGVPGISVDWWLGVLAPTGTPEPIIQKLSTEIMALSKQPEFRTRLLNQGIEVLGSTPEQFAAVLKEEVPRWRAVVNTAGIKLQ